MRRRSVLASAAAWPLAACRPEPAAPPPSRWVGASHERGHRLRGAKSGQLPPPAVQRRAGVLVVGGGVAGLSALRALVRAGAHDAQLLELEEAPGGNSRGHAMGGLRCPLGAHYLPVPGPAAHEVNEWLYEIGLLRSELGRTVADERHLCHSPQERLFIDGAWQEGLLPSAEGRPRTLAQYRAFAAAVAAAQREMGFAIPTRRAPWTAGHAALDGQTFAAWLATRGLDDERLLAYLDYACRDDYGAGPATVSAWAGLHYFASRHGFHAPGDGDGDGEREGVFTWPEGNAWLVDRLAAPLRERLHGGRTVLQVREDKHEVRLLAWDEGTARLEAWRAERVVLAVPLFIAARLLDPVPDALAAAASSARYAPWLVANLQLDRRPLDRPGTPPSWDNVRYATAGSTTSLGYVDATHQALSPVPGATVFTAYHALPEARRGELLGRSAAAWAGDVLADIAALHPDLAPRVQAVDLMRYGHAMHIPVPGAHSQLAAAALETTKGRLRFAHADLSGYSIFEEAFTAGAAVASPRR